MAELALASLSISLAGNLIYLLSLHIKQEHRNRAYQSRLEKAQRHTRQIRDTLSQVVENSEQADLVDFRPQLESLSKALPQFRADLSNAETGDDVDKLIERLSQQVDAVEDLSKQIISDNLIRDTKLKEIVVDSSSQDSSIQQHERQIPKITITESLFDELQDSRPSLIRVYSPDHSDVRADIIFVHGLNDNARNTWSGRTLDGGQKPFYWPRDLLAHDLTDHAIWIYSFDSDIMTTVTPDRPLIHVLDQYTDKLVHCIQDNIHLDSRRKARHITWVAHSLGGLIVKNALTGSGEVNSAAQLDVRTQSVLFLGTPHSGSSLSARVSRLTDIIFSRGAPGLKNKPSPDNLSLAFQLQENSSIVNIASRFAALMDMQNLPVVSFFETDALLVENGPRLMVESFCRISHPNEAVEYLEGNHHTMCKFDSEKERGYQQILMYLKKLSGNNDSKTSISMRQERSRTRTYSRTTLTDPEFTDVDAIYRRLRMKIDWPSTRWTPERADTSNGNWFIKENAFEKWLDLAEKSSKAVKPLVIMGPTGSGKTMIAESIIQELQMRSLRMETISETCQLQLFFKSNQASRQSAVMILVGFIAQLLDRNRLLARHLNQRAEELEEPSNDKLTRALLKGTLRRMLEDSCWNRVYVVVDGLEECAQTHVKTFCDLLSWMIGVDKVRMILTNSDEIISQLPSKDLTSNTLDSNLFSDLKKELFQKGLSIELEWVNHSNAWKALMKVHITKSLALAEDDRANSNQWKTLRRDYRLRLQDSLFEMVDLRSTSISFSLVDIILQYLRYRNTTTFDREDEFLANTEIEELSSLTNVYTILLALVTKQERSVVNAICILACALEPLRTRDVAALKHFMWSSTLLDQEVISQHADDLKMKLHQPKMQYLVTVEADGLRLSRSLVREALLSENPEGRRDQHSLVQSAILVQLSDSGNKSQDQDHILFSDREPIRHIINFYLARACLRMLIAIQSSQADLTNPPRGSLLYSGETYARKNWTAHMRGAGKLAGELNMLVRQFIDAQSSQDLETSNTKANLDVGALKLLAHENLFENLGAAFEDSEVRESSDLYELETLLNDTKSLPEPETLIVIEKNLAAQSLRWSLSAAWRRRRFMRKLRLVMSIKVGKNAALEELVRRFWPSPSEVNYLAKVAIQEQNAEALAIVLRNYSHYLEANSAGTLLTLAVQFQRQKLVEPLLMYPDLFDFQAGLFTAVETGNEEACEVLLAHGADVNAVNKSGTAVLHLAASSGLQNIVDCFVRWNASVNLMDRKGRTALHLAAEFGHTSVAETLLANSCSLTAKDTQGRTALFIGCACGQIDIVRNLWILGASLNDTDSHGRTLLHAAARKGQTEIVEMLLNAGIDCSVRDHSGVTPLHEAAEHGWVPIGQLLVEAGADVMHRSTGKATALHFACTAEQAPEAMVDFLLAHGCDTTACDLQGRTPILLAGHFSTVRVLTRLLGDDSSLRNHKDYQGHGLRDYVMFPVHLTAEEERTLSANSKSRRIDRRKANQREKQQFLGYDELTAAAEPGWTMYELRDFDKWQGPNRKKSLMLSWW